MKLYFSIIGMAMLVISAVNILLDTAVWHYVIVLVVICTALQFVLDGIIAVIINKMPDSLFGVNNPLYRVSEFEKELYKKLKVRLWKDKVWELGGLGGFSKKNFTDPRSPEYIEKFIIESNKGVLTHRLSYPIGFLSMLFVPKAASISIALPIAAVNLFLNVLPTLVLRYNTPKLMSMLQRLSRRGKKSDSCFL